VKDVGQEHAALDRVRGCLLGLAVGDALGTTLEFERPGSFTPIDDMVGGGPFNVAPGQWTDDTSMALCLAESLIERQGFDPIDQLERYERWWREGHLSWAGRCFDIGTTTVSALGRFGRTREPYCGSPDPATAGNGSIMRLAPVPIYYRGHLRKAIDFAAASSRTTHRAPEAVDACRFLASLLVGLLNGIPKDEVLAPAYEAVSGLWDREPLARLVARMRRGSYCDREPPQIRGSGYVIACLEAALWAFARTSDFRAGVLTASASPLRSRTMPRFAESFAVRRMRASPCFSRKSWSMTCR